MGLLIPTKVRISVTLEPLSQHILFDVAFLGEGASVQVKAPALIAPDGLIALLGCVSDYVRTQMSPDPYNPPPSIEAA